MNAVLIRCSAHAPWSCDVECRACGDHHVIAGPHPTTNHRDATALAAEHHCPKG